MRIRGSTALVALLAVVVSLAGCATVQQGQDPVVVRTEQTLAIGQYVYDGGMSWCKANAGRFSVEGLATVNKVRVAFPDAYHALDTALDTYKAAKGGDLTTALSKLNEIVGQIEALVLAAGGPDLGALATAQFGGG